MTLSIIFKSFFREVCPQQKSLNKMYFFYNKLSTSEDGFVEITDNRIWSNDVYSCVYFNKFVKQSIESDIM